MKKRLIMLVVGVFLCLAFSANAQEGCTMGSSFNEELGVCVPPGWDAYRKDNPLDDGMKAAIISAAKKYHEKGIDNLTLKSTSIAKEGYVIDFYVNLGGE